MTFEHILLVDSSVPDSRVFVDSVNANTCAIVYTSRMKKNELMDMIRSKLSSQSVDRMGIVFRLNSNSLFVERKSFFNSEDFLVALIKEFGIKNIDFLACNTLKYPLWKSFYGRLADKSGVIVGASNDKTGNLKYSGDWIMESTGENIELIYFTTAIEYYKYLLDNSASTLFAGSDGLYGMGNNGSYQLGLPANDSIIAFTLLKHSDISFTDVKQIACSQENAMILLNNGNLYGAGDNSVGQLGLGNTTTNELFTLLTTGVDQVACGYHFTIILKGTTLYGAGDNSGGQLGLNTSTYPSVSTFTVIPTGSGATEIFGSFNNSFILKGTTLYGTGDNSVGQLGLSINDHPSLQEFTLLTTNVDKISFFYSFTLILKGTTLYGTGDNNSGQLGLSPTTYPLLEVFTEIPSGSGATQISCGIDHSLILKGTTLYGAGNNSYSRLGLNVANYEQLSTFTVIPSGSGATKVSCGETHSMILKGTTLYGTGSNSSGQLGLNMYAYPTLSQFTVIPSGAGATNVVSSNYNTLIIKDTSVYGTGNNIYLQLGFPAQVQISVPTKINNFTNIKQIIPGLYFSLVLLTNGFLYGAGDGGYGNFGIGNTNTLYSFTLLTTGVSKIACSGSHTLILKGTTLYGAGENSSGQLGLNTTTYPSVNTFTVIPSGAGATQIACGSTHSVILKGTSLYVTGRNAGGEIGLDDSPGVDTFTEIPDYLGCTLIAANDWRTMIFKGGTLYGTGLNDYGQLGLPSSPSGTYLVFTEIPSGAGTTQISCGGQHTMILKGTTLYGTGYNEFGQLGLDPESYSRLNEFTAIPNKTDVDQVVCGYGHTVILRGSSFYAVGDNFDGQLGLDPIVYPTNYDFDYTPNATTVLFLTVTSSPDQPPDIQSTICFPAGTLVKTDQGLIEIQKLKPKINTLNGQVIVAITDTYCMDNELVCIEKDALRKNYPNTRTVISKRHKIFYKGKMKAAHRFVGQKGVSFIPYEGGKLYNVLLGVYGAMNVNGMICETLHPVNPVARIYKAYQDASQ